MALNYTCNKNDRDDSQTRASTNKTAVSVSHVTMSVDITENIMSDAIGTTGERSKPSQLKIADP